MIIVVLPLVQDGYEYEKKMILLCLIFVSESLRLWYSCPCVCCVEMRTMYFAVFTVCWDYVVYVLH